MSQAKNKRAYKRQKGQFLTPQVLAREILADVEFDVADRVLEPGFGDGSFLLPMIEAFLELYEGPVSSRLRRVLNNNIWGIEIDPVMYDKALSNIEERIGPLPESHNLMEGDFFETQFEGHTLRPDLARGSFGYDIEFTHIIGNPPFGGTIAYHLQDSLDKELGWRHGMKIKKETFLGLSSKAWIYWRAVECLGSFAVAPFLPSLLCGASATPWLWKASLLCGRSTTFRKKLLIQWSC